MDITFSNGGVGRYDITTEHTLPLGVPRTFLFVLAFGFPVLFRLALPAVEVVEASVQVASASMDAQAVLDEAHVEEEADVNDVSASRSISTWAAKASGFVIGHHLFQRWCMAIWHHH